MDQVHVVRHKVLVEGLSARAVASAMGLSRNTVARYLSRSVAVRIEQQARATPVLDQVGPRIEAILGEAPRWIGGELRLIAVVQDATACEEIWRHPGLWQRGPPRERRVLLDALVAPVKSVCLRRIATCRSSPQG